MCLSSQPASALWGSLLSFLFVVPEGWPHTCLEHGKVQGCHASVQVALTWENGDSEERCEHQERESVSKSATSPTSSLLALVV